MPRLRRIFLPALVAAAVPAAAAAQRAPVKVIVLAGQSNMEGKAQNKLWEHQATLHSIAICVVNHALPEGVQQLHR